MSLARKAQSKMSALDTTCLLARGSTQKKMAERTTICRVPSTSARLLASRMRLRDLSLSLIPYVNDGFRNSIATVRSSRVF